MNANMSLKNSFLSFASTFQYKFIISDKSLNFFLTGTIFVRYVVPSQRKFDKLLLNKATSALKINPFHRQVLYAKLKNNLTIDHPSNKYQHVQNQSAIETLEECW